MPYWETQIAPEVRAGKRVIIAAHGELVKRFKCTVYVNLLFVKDGSVALGPEAFSNSPLPCPHTLSSPSPSGNSLRALVKYLDNIPEDVIPSLNIPTGVPLVYNLDENLKPIKSPLAIAPLSVSKTPVPTTFLLFGVDGSVCGAAEVLLFLIFTLFSPQCVHRADTWATRRTSEEESRASW